MASQADLLAQLADTAERTAGVLDRIDKRQRDQDNDERARRDFERAHSRIHEPRRLNFAVMARAAPGLAQQFMQEPAKQVPSEFWQLDGDAAIIACPCEADPNVPVQQPVTCECGRMFVFDGDQVRVLPATFFAAEDEPPRPRS